MPDLMTVGEHPIRFQLANLVTAPKPMIRDALGTTADGLNTYGWDTVFAIRPADVNSALAKSTSSPTTYDYSETAGGNSVRASGTFGIFAVTTGGDGPVLYMSVPLPTGNLTYGSETFPYSDGVATLSIQLDYVPLTPPADSNGNPNALRIDTEKPVTVEDIDWTGTQPDGIVTPFLRDLIEKWFAANMESFQHTFAVVDLDSKASRDDFQWMRPTSLGYAYYQPLPSSALSDCVFGVLAMTENRDASDNSWQISPDAIPDQARAGFIISGERYLNSILLAKTPDMFQNASASDFQITPGATEITNVNELKMNPLNNYVPTVGAGDFSVTFGNGDLTLSITRAHIKISPGIDLYLDYTIHVGCRLEDRGDGTQALVLYDIGDIEYSHTVETASWVVITEIVAGLIAGVVFAGIGSVGGSAVSKAIVSCTSVEADSITAQAVKWVVAAIIGAIVGGLVGNIATIIAATAEAKAADLPDFNPFAQEGVDTTNWPGGTQTILQNVSFNHALHIGVDPQFVD